VDKVNKWFFNLILALFGVDKFLTGWWKTVWRKSVF